MPDRCRLGAVGICAGGNGECAQMTQFWPSSVPSALDLADVHLSPGSLVRPGLQVG